MNAFAGEALFIGIKEGCKLAACALLAVALFRAYNHRFLEKPLVISLAGVLLGSAFVFTVPVSPQARELVASGIGYVFGLFYLLALGIYALHAHNRARVPVSAILLDRIVLAPVTVILTVFYFSPDMIGSSFYLKDLAGMSGQPVPVLAAGGAGFLLSLAGVFLLARRVRFDVSRLFGWPQFLLLLAMVKLFGGGARGFAEFSLIPSVQRGLMKFVHDGVHHLLVTLMVPDHPILSVTTWNAIGLLFGENLALWFALAMFTAPLLFVLRVHATMPIPVPWDIADGALSRKYRKSVRDARLLKSLPVILFLVFIVSTWFVQRGETGVELINPTPAPVVAEQGRVTIPLSAPGRELRDGGMHKFSFDLEGEQVRLLIMKRPDGTLAVCLDACEICPPDGYVLGRKHVICLYCNTPIPVETLGKPGGCNPVPLRALVTESSVVIETADIAASWTKVKSQQKGVKEAT